MYSLAVTTDPQRLRVAQGPRGPHWGCMQDLHATHDNRPVTDDAVGQGGSADVKECQLLHPLQGPQRGHAHKARPLQA